MPYVSRLQWALELDRGAGFGLDCLLTTTPTDLVLGTFLSPTKADLNNATLYGAYLDVVIPSFTNTFAGSNWILSDTAYPKIICTPSGFGSFDVITDLTLACNSNSAGTYPYTRIYGDKNFASVFKYNRSHDVTIYNIRSEQNNIRLNNFHFILRLYVR